MTTKEYNPPPPEDQFTEETHAVPHSREAEEAVVGAILINPECYYEVRQTITPDEFYIHRNKWIMQAFDTLIENQTPIDLLTLSEQLEKQNQLGEVGGSAYITSLINQVPTSLNALAYAYIVQEHAVRRKIISQANLMASLAYKGVSIDKVVQEYESIISGVIDTAFQDATQDSDEVSLTLLEKVRNNTPTGVKTFFPIFDKFENLGALPIGATLLIGDSSFGKSVWGLQICEHNALQGIKALYFGFESENEQMVIRRIGGSAYSGIPFLSKKLRAGTLSQAEQQKVEQTIVNEYQGKYKGNLKFNSKARTLREIEQAVRKHKPKVVVIDQISQITDAPTSNPTMNFLLNFTKLKIIGNDYGCAVVVVHAITPEESKMFFKKNAKAQAGQKQSNLIPNINAIPWATSMKFLADVILFLVPDVGTQLIKATVYDILIWIMKDRDGNRFVPTYWKFDLLAQWFEDLQPPTPPNKKSGTAQQNGYTPPQASQGVMYAMEPEEDENEPDESELV